MVAGVAEEVGAEVLPVECWVCLHLRAWLGHWSAGCGRGLRRPGLRVWVLPLVRSVMVLMSWHEVHTACRSSGLTACALVWPVDAMLMVWSAMVASPIQPGYWSWHVWPASSRQMLRALRDARVEP